MTIKRVPVSTILLLGLALGIGLYGLAGCGSFLDRQYFATESRNTDADWYTLCRGNNAFHQGQYGRSIEIFSNLSQLASMETVRRQALYGLACTKLVLAKNVAEMNESIVLWNTWCQLLPETMGWEDPRMLTPLLSQKLKAVNVPPKKNDAVLIRKPKVDPGILQAKDQKIAELNTKLTEMKMEIDTLKHQISSLEAIDQKIQEKKKEISAP